MKREYLRKGSFTIEAACVMSLVLLVLMGVLYLTFFVHNRAWLTAAACESALTGSIEGIRKDGQAEQGRDQMQRAWKCWLFWSRKSDGTGAERKKDQGDLYC